jgi:hypothetical protein
MKMKLALIAATVGIMLVGSPVSAHHSFAGTYLEDATPVTVEGTLVAFLVRNPHSFVHVEDATKKDPKTGEPIRWSIEWGAAGQLAQQGVRTGSLKVGDKVKVVGSPGRNAEDFRLRMRSITRPSDGWTWPVGNQTFN